MAAAANAATLAAQQLQIQHLLDTVAALQGLQAAGALVPAAAVAAGAGVALGYDPAYNAAQLALSRRAAAQPPPFFRGKIGLETNRWLQEVALYHEDAGLVTDAEKLQVTARYLQGPAQIFWEANRQLTAADPLKITTWAQLSAALRKRFEPTDVAQWARYQLDALVGKGMLNLAAYNDQFQDLMAVIPAMDERDRVHNYLKGLPAYLRGALMAKSNEWLTLQQNLEAAVRLEASRSLGTGSSTSTPFAGGFRGGNNRQRPAGISMMEEEQESAALQQQSTAELLQAMQAQLNAMQSSGRGRDSKSAWPAPARIPGLSFDLINARKARGLCIKCGKSGHMKWECTNAADITTQPSGK